MWGIHFLRRPKLAPVIHETPLLPMMATVSEDVWPDNPDEVPAWVLRAEALRSRIGIAAPLPARTRREFDQKVDLAEMTAALVIAGEPNVPQKPLSPYEAAERFLASLRHNEDVGEFSAHELSALYSRHCADSTLTPAAIDHVKAELALMPGVHRDQRDMGKNPKSGRRQRQTFWIIAPQCEVKQQDEPKSNVVDLREVESNTRLAWAA